MSTRQRVLIPAYREDLIASLAYLYGCESRLFRPMHDQALREAFAAIARRNTGIAGISLTRSPA